MSDTSIVDLYERHARAFDRERSRSLQEKAWLAADMRELALDRRFDGLLAWDSFFHLSGNDQRGMFARFARHARSGAPLMFTSGTSEGEVVGSFAGEPLYHASLDPSEYGHLLSTNGFAVHKYVPNDPECRGHTVWLAVYGETAPS